MKWFGRTIYMEVISVKEVDMLKRLAFEAGVQTSVLAKLCDCSPSAIGNYLHDHSLPNGSKLANINKGLQEYKELINEIIQE